MPLRVLVTGGAGFIGSSLARALVKRGDSVRVLDNLSSGKRSNLEDILHGVEWIEGDILDPNAMRRSAEGVQVIFHQAAIPSVPRSVAAPVPSHEANASGTLQVLEAARALGVRRVVYAGSSSAYGDTAVLPKVETMPAAPLSPYAVSKLAGEMYCQMYARTMGLETVVLRYFNVFGPRQDPTSPYAAVIPRFITAALRDQPAVVFGDGGQSRDFCYIDNVVQANLLAAEAPEASGRVFNIACGVATELNAVLDLLGKLIGSKVAARYEPPRTGDVKRSLADIALARRYLGYSPEIMFDDGFRRTFDWLRTAAA
jgi:UDP-glucose 4-epimerase